MKLLGTTGTRACVGDVAQRYSDWLVSPEMRIRLRDFDGFVSGGCIGWDAVFGYSLALVYPDKDHYVVVPANRKQIDPWWEEFDPGYVQLMYMPEESSYRDRNAKIVGLSSELLYVAEYPEEHGKSVRSGTWQTIRLARAAKLPVTGVILRQEM